MEKIRILYIHHGGLQGGAPRSLSFLIKQLDKSIYEPYVLVGVEEDKAKELFETAGAKVIYKSGVGAWHGSTVSGMNWRTLRGNLKRMLPTYRFTKEVMKQVRPNIVHLNSTCLFFAAKAVKKINKNIPVVCHVREPLLEGVWGNILRKGNRGRIDYYVAIEQYDAETLHQTETPVSIIYNFVDFNLYNYKVSSTLLRDELNIPCSDIIFLYLARIGESNGALPLVRNFKRCFSNSKNVHLCIVGMPDNNRNEYQQRVQDESEYETNIHILNFRNDVTDVIASSDILIAPFVTPHFARSVIEAGAMGVPCIASNIGGLREQVVDGKTGVLFDFENYGGFEEACRRLIEDGEFRRKLGEGAIEFARENFDSVKNARRTFEIYEKLLSDAGAV